MQTSIHGRRCTCGDTVPPQHPLQTEHSRAPPRTPAHPRTPPHTLAQVSARAHTHTHTHIIGFQIVSFTWTGRWCAVQQRQGATCAWRFSMPRSTETDAEGSKGTTESTEASAVLRRSKIDARRKGAEWTWLLYHRFDTSESGEREKAREGERGKKVLLTIKKCLYVGKHNALSGNTASRSPQAGGGVP